MTTQSLEFTENFLAAHAYVTQVIFPPRFRAPIEGPGTR